MDAGNTIRDLVPAETKASNPNSKISFFKKPFKVVSHHMQHKDCHLSVIMTPYIKIKQVRNTQTKDTADTFFPQRNRTMDLIPQISGC